jgi:hypothetical protein
MLRDGVNRPVKLIGLERMRGTIFLAQILKEGMMTKIHVVIKTVVGNVARINKTLLNHATSCCFSCLSIIGRSRPPNPRQTFLKTDLGIV